MSGDVFGDVCELSTTLVSLYAEGGAVFLLCWLFGLRYSGTGVCRQLGATRS